MPVERVFQLNRVGTPTWANKEKQILFDVEKDPANAGTNHQEKINVCFVILQKHGYERTKAAIKIKRMRLKLQTPKDAEFAGNVSAAEMFEETMLIRDEMVDLLRGVQIDRYKDALLNLDASLRDDLSGSVPFSTPSLMLLIMR